MKIFTVRHERNKIHLISTLAIAIFICSINQSMCAKSPLKLTPRSLSGKCDCSKQQKHNEIHSHGYWIGKGASAFHVYDASLSKAIAAFFLSQNASSVIDLGAGMGHYAKEFMSQGIFTSCYDGNPNTVELTEGRCATADLTHEIHFVKHDWVMSLEVGEHIPAGYEKIFIQNLHRVNKKGMVLSWAIEGIAHGHVNVRSNKYIKEKIMALGYTNDVEMEQKLRKARSNAGWFKDSMMVFKRIVPL